MLDAFRFCNSAKELKGAKIESARVDWIGQGIILSKPSQNENAIGIKSYSQLR